jgi:16S rRNA (cytidine1402-2'-O)-methyltransferase
VIATPIGNLEDLSPRALERLRAVACIACEDTRRTAKLLSRFGIETRTLSCHKFNEHRRLHPILAMIRDGSDVALVSDGGTPGVSDPGSLLVKAALDEGVRVCPIPGPSAPMALLSASGLPADRVAFDGFLPHRSAERRRRLRDLRSEPRTIVVFETPHRIRQALEDIGSVFGERPCVLGREMTKLHETILRGSAKEILSALGPDPVQGEIAIAIAGAPEDGSIPEEPADVSRVRDAWRAALRTSSGDRRGALRHAARALSMKRPDLYRFLEEIGEVAGEDGTTR